MKLTDIGSQRVRNLVRGALGATDLNVLERTFASIRKEASLSELSRTYEFFLTNSLAQHLPLPDLFLSKPRSGRNSSFFKETTLEKELTIELERIHQAQEKLLKFSSEVDKINRAYFGGEVEKCAKLLITMRVEYGPSLYLLRKVMSILDNLDFNAEVRQILEGYVKEWTTPNPDVYYLAVRDILDRGRSYTKTRKTFLGFISSGYMSGVQAELIKDVFSPSVRTKEQMAYALQAYSNVSVVDSFIFLANNFENLLSRCDEIHSSDRVIDARKIVSVWQNLNVAINISSLLNCNDGEKKFDDYVLFRHSIAWPESIELLNFRLSIERLASSRMTEQYSISDIYLLPKELSDGASVKDLCVEYSSKTKVPILDIKSALETPNETGAWLKSAITCSLVGKSSGPEYFEGSELFLLLNNTIDIAYLLPTEEFDSFFKEARTDRLFTYLKRAIISDAKRLTMNEFKFRKALQDIVANEFDGDIISFADFLLERGNHVAEHMIEFCDEFQLAQLYRLYPTANDAVIAKTKLLKYHAKHFDSPESEELAKSIQLDMKLSKVKGDIDENRIYVDLVRFRNWAVESISRELQNPKLLDTNPSIYASNIRLLQNPLEIIRSPEQTLINVLEKAFDEFYSNKNFGMISYVGRRIRHGTLEGTFLADIRKIIDAERVSLEDLNPKVVEKVESWYDNYKLATDCVGLELLRIKSKAHPNGLFVASLRDEKKSAVRSVFLNEVYRDLSAGKSANDILSVIMTFCWAGLEVDLKVARSTIHALLTDDLMMNASELSRGSDTATAKLLRVMCRKINSAVTEAFTKVESWLHQPSNLYPTATLSELFEATIIEARETHTEFYPSVTKLGDTELSINGHRYHYFYDVIEPMVVNAAKHGPDVGKLSFEVKSCRAGNLLQIEMVVNSEIKQKANIEQVMALLKEAQESEIGDANVEEGGSGIRKIRSLVRDVPEITAYSSKVVGRHVRSIVKAEVPHG